MKVTTGDMLPIGQGEGFCEPTEFVEPEQKPLSWQKTARVKNMYEESREEAKVDLQHVNKVAANSDFPHRVISYHLSLKTGI